MIASLVTGKPRLAAMESQVSPCLVGCRTVSTRLSGSVTEIYDIPKPTERHTFMHMEQHEIAFSDDQE
jgi:hypothetical protein